MTREDSILAALDQGDPDRALTLLMQDYGRALYRFCHQLLADSELAEEVHQMAFVQAYESFHRFARRSSLKTWLFSIARHRCLDALKARRRHRWRFQQAETLPDSPDPRGTDEDRLVERGQIRSLENCLGELQPRVRSAVLLRFQEGFSYVEMARISNERAATLQARVVRALPVLRRCLQEGVTP